MTKKHSRLIYVSTVHAYRCRRRRQLLPWVGRHIGKRWLCSRRSLACATAVRCPDRFARKVPAAGFNQKKMTTEKIQPRPFLSALYLRHRELTGITLESTQKTVAPPELPGWCGVLPSLSSFWAMVHVCCCRPWLLAAPTSGKLFYFGRNLNLPSGLDHPLACACMNFLSRNKDLPPLRA